MSLGTMSLGTVSLRRNRGRALAALLGLVLTGCPGPSATLEILSPVDGETLSLATDTNPSLAGVQTDVVVQANGIAVGDAVDLIVDEVIYTSQPTPEDGQFTFADVTLSPGDHVIRASRAGTVESARVTVTVTSDECFAISFVTPTPGGSRVTLGAADDVDGEACGATFEAEVVISTDAGNGAEARVFVNGTPQLTASVSGATARFDGVVLDNRGDDPNTLSVEVTNADGVACRQDFPVPVFVDCDGASCAITLPDSTTSFLNHDDDVSDEPGFQTDFEVTTGSDGAGQPIRLILDGNETDALSAIPTMVGSGGVAAFGNVGLSEGVHRVQAACVDDTGNPSRSAVVEWLVDITPCGLALTDPAEGTLFVDADDVDASTEGVQIDAAGTAAGDCDTLRVGLCASIDSVAYGSAVADWSQTITLGSSRNQELCVQAQDAAGNTATATAGVLLNTAAPQLEIVTPGAGTGFNRLGTGGRTADLAPGSATCEVAFAVNCTEVGAEVTLLRNDTMTQVGGGSAICAAMAGLPAPYLGQAAFANVSLPSLPGASLPIVARQEHERLVGLSDPIVLLSDCDLPVLSLFEPMCGALLRASDDGDPGTPGLQRRVRFQNPNVPKPPITLELRDSTGANIYGPVTSSNPVTGVTTEFLNANFGGAGVVTVVGTATDEAGNEGTVSCDVTVSDLPNLSIGAPAAGTVLSTADDCDSSAPGLQIAVRATTDAEAASTASVQIGGAGTATVALSDLTDANGACVDASDGRSLPIVVTVTDPTRGAVMASVVVHIDSLPPTTSIGDLVPQDPPVDRRGGIVRFTWTAVEDQGGGSLESYEMRCASSAIATPTDWTNASPRMITLVPGTPTTTQSADVAGFRVGVESFCVLRGRDIAGALTPLPSTSPASVELEFFIAEWDSSATGDGNSIAAVGDVNDDGIDDVLVGAGQGAALLFGATSGLPTSASVRILPPAGAVSFGSVVAGLGDFNGDGHPDFAIADPSGNSFRGSVYVIFGRPSTSAWPATIDLSAGCPGICVNGTSTMGGLGWDTASAGDFDGDGRADVAVTVPGTRTVYVVRGSAVTGTFDLPSAGVSLDGFAITAAAGTFGNAVTSPGDLGADGRSELVIGSPGSGTAGEVFRLNGRTYPAATTGIVSVPPSELSLLATGAASFGLGVRAQGDFDGDGLVDIGVYDGTSAGRVVVLLQRAGTYSLTDSVAFTNDLAGSASDRFGSSLGLGMHPVLGAFGDLDSDGRVDLIAGSNQRGTAAGVVDLFYGARPAVARMRSASDLFLDPLPAASTGTRRGQYIGDVNGDGYADAAVGDPSFASNAGRVVVYY